VRVWSLTHHGDGAQVTKLQTGGPDGDLGSNEILLSHDITHSIVDGSGVLHDPKGLNRDELCRLAKLRVTADKVCSVVSMCCLRV
jgi:NAD-specific glutamate dehydrogenase